MSEKCCPVCYLPHSSFAVLAATYGSHWCNINGRMVYTTHRHILNFTDRMSQIRQSDFTKPLYDL